jgi:hypothetical protein
VINKTIIEYYYLEKKFQPGILIWLSRTAFARANFTSRTIQIQKKQHIPEHVTLLGIASRCQVVHITRLLTERQQIGHVEPMLRDGIGLAGLENLKII